MTLDTANTQTSATNLEQLVANTCFCKLRTFCADKNNQACLKHKNMYAEFMREKSAKLGA